jgi:hypothetical protein
MEDAKFLGTIAGRFYKNAPDAYAPGQPFNLKICHRDDELSRLTLTVFDALDVDGVPFPEFNGVPDPLLDPNIPVVFWYGWSDGPMVKAFEGVLVAKTINTGGSVTTTTFLAAHKSFKLKKKSKMKTYENLSVAQMLKMKAAEHGSTLIIDATAAADAELNNPRSVFYQLGEPNIDLMYRYTRELGYIFNTIKSHQIIVRRDKSSGQTFSYTRGDEFIKTLSLRQEQHDSKRSARRQGMTHESRPGKHSHHKPIIEPADSEHRDTELVQAPLAKSTQHQRRPLAKGAVDGKAKRRKIEGNELTLSIRFEPRMFNIEMVSISGHGSQINGLYHTRSVEHTLGNTPATTNIECWKPQT